MNAKNQIITIIFLLAWGAIVGYLATNRGRVFFTWFIISLLATPLLALIALYVKKTLVITLPCPACAYPVKSNQSICKSCNHGLVSDEIFIRSASLLLNEQSKDSLADKNRIAEEGDKAFQSGLPRSSNPYRLSTAPVENLKFIDFWDRGFTVAENRKKREKSSGY